MAGACRAGSVAYVSANGRDGGAKSGAGGVGMTSAGASGREMDEATDEYDVD